jgi:hypothetical protein
MPEQLHEILNNVEPLPLVAGLLFLFAGWLLYWASVNVSGALVVGGMGFVVAEGVLHYLPQATPLQANMLRIGSVVAGLVLGVVIGRQIHRLAFFCLGWLLGAVGYFKLMGVLARDFDWAKSDLIVAFGTPVMGLIVGFLAVQFDRLLIAAAASVVGALLIEAGLREQLPFWAAPAIALFGFVTQMALTRKRRAKKED